jgi:hypothetical protein
LLVCISSITSYAQTINISTGDGTSGAGTTDPEWKVNSAAAITVPSYGSYWQATPIQGCGARWLNPTATVGTQAPGFYTYERTITVAPGIKTLSLNFQVAYDDVLTSLELVPPSGPAIPLAVTSHKPYFMGEQIITSQDVCGKTGTWKLRAKVQYIDALGAFIVCGTANLTKGDCCDCNKPTNTNVNFSLTTTLGGGTTATVSAIGASTALGNGWTLKEVAGGGVNPCKWVPGSIKWQSVGANITIPAGVLVPGKCYVLTHYVNVCSTKWNPKACVQYKAICFCVCDNTITVQPDIKQKSIQGLQKRATNSEEEGIEKEAQEISDPNGTRG